MRVIIGREKHDTPVYASYLACVRSRYECGDYSYGGREFDAKYILDSGNEKLAQRFIWENSDWEYEGADETEVIE